MAPRPGTAIRTRPLRADDLDEVVRIDARYTGAEKRDYWQRVFRDYLGQKSRPRTFGFGVENGTGLSGYVFGEIRAVEFGSEPCGWVFAIGVDEERRREGIASALLAAACARFRRAGVTTVRTMMRRNDVPVLSFFRSQGFTGGPYVQLELELPPPRGAEEEEPS